jgi:hypothetical protein
VQYILARKRTCACVRVCGVVGVLCVCVRVCVCVNISWVKVYACVSVCLWMMDQ